MKLEVMLSVMNLQKKDLDKMNITSKCTVINQCKKNNFEQYKNFNIYSYNEVGAANSRNRGLEHITEDIIVICDDDVIYTDTYEKDILDEFKKNPKADIIIFNIDSPNRKIRINKKNKRLHFYNILSYSAQRIAFRKNSIKNIKFNVLFGGGAKYSSGEDTLFLVDALKDNLKIYLSTKNIGIVNHETSTWFKGYTEKYFYDKGALFTAISKKYRKILCLQYLLRHKEALTNYKLKEAYKIMKKGSNDYLEQKKTKE
jgi:glycosyltransferase involved in cell wall biosynthesis